MVRQMLLMSSSKTPANGKWMDYAVPTMTRFLRAADRPVRTVAFVPYAGVTIAHDAYTTMANGIFGDRLGFQLRSVHAAPNPVDLLAEADAICVGGGNTWVLNQALHAHGLRDIIRRRVLDDGIPYIGWSAGAVVAFGGMETTNDLCIVDAPVLPALGLIGGSLRLNPHYLDPWSDDLPFAEVLKRMRAVMTVIAVVPSLFRTLWSRGESRADRMAEYFTLQDPEGCYLHDGPVIGLYEGGMLHVTGETMTLTGVAGAKVFSREGTARFKAGADLSFLLP